MNLPFACRYSVILVLRSSSLSKTDVFHPYGFFSRVFMSLLKAQHHPQSHQPYPFPIPHACATNSDASIHFPLKIPPSSVKTCNNIAICSSLDLDSRSSFAFLYPCPVLCGGHRTSSNSASAHTAMSLVGAGINGQECTLGGTSASAVSESDDPETSCMSPSSETVSAPMIKLSLAFEEVCC